MTRETKLGLVVGISFLSLVGVVGYTQWRKGEQTTPPPETPQPGMQASKSSDKPKSAAPSTVGQPVLGQNPGTATAKDSEFPPLSQFPGGPPIAPAPMPGIAPPPITNSQPTPIPNSQPSGPGAPGAGTGVPGPAFPPTQPQLGTFPGTQNNNSTPIIGGAPAPMPPTAPKPAIGGFDFPPFPGQDPAKTAPLPGSSGPPVPLPINQGTPLKNPGQQDNPSPINLNSQFPQVPLPGAPGAALPGNFNPQFGNSSPVPPPGGGFGNIPEPKQQAPLPGNPGSTNPFDIGNKPMQPPGQQPNFGAAGGLKNGTIPPPAGSPAAGGAVTKESYNERSHVCQPGDNDFDAVSRKFFNGSDKYAKALVEYNRDHPNGRDAVTFAPNLRQGTLVFIPPLPVLESKYAQFIPNFRPLTPDNQKGQSGGVIPPPAMVPVGPNPATGSQPPAGFPGASVPPSPGNWGNPPNPTGQPATPPAPGSQGGVVPAGSWSGPSNTGTGDYKLYRVPQAGKRLSDIAQDTLGNPNRWTEIIRLNPQLRENELVPMGTQLWLPPDARTGQ